MRMQARPHVRFLREAHPSAEKHVDRLLWARGPVEAVSLNPLGAPPMSAASLNYDPPEGGV